MKIQPLVYVRSLQCLFALHEAFAVLLFGINGDNFVKRFSNYVYY